MSCICGHIRDEHYNTGECRRFYPELRDSGKIVLHHCEKFRTNLEFLEYKFEQKEKSNG
jgi:hypothetical protein